MAVDRAQLMGNMRTNLAGLRHGSLGIPVLLLVMLCLGSQNLEQREELNLGVGRSAPLPTGFVVGIALICGVLSGGSAAALLLPEQR